MVRQINQDLPEGVDGNLWNKMMADLRGLVWQHAGSDGGFRELAEKANLSESTIVNFAYGYTKSPLFSTIVKLMQAVDRVEQLRNVFAGSEKPVTIRDLRRLAKRS